jgi:hypothetical protein
MSSTTELVIFEGAVAARAWLDAVDAAAAAAELPRNLLRFMIVFLPAAGQ